MTIRDRNLVSAAVALTLVGDTNGNTAFILTRRPKSLRRHAGQWALPGGRSEKGESALVTACRELDEEVGVNIDQSGYIGMLDDFATRSGFLITPVLLWGPASPLLRPDPIEVQGAYLIPLEALNAPDVPKIDTTNSDENPLISVPIKELNTSIWAPTAALLYQMREITLHGRTTRVAHYEQPPFARK